MHPSPSAIDRVSQQSAEMARDGLRVIAVAYGSPDNTSGGQKMTFCGIVGLKDPLREGHTLSIHSLNNSYNHPINTAHSMYPPFNTFYQPILSLPLITLLSPSHYLSLPHITLSSTLTPFEFS